MNLILKDKISKMLTELEDENVLMMLTTHEDISERILKSLSSDLVYEVENEKQNSLMVSMTNDELWYIVRGSSALRQHIPASSLPTYTGFDEHQIDSFSSRVRKLISDIFDE